MSRSGTPAKAASIKDIATAAGVSLGTVSNVLNRPERVAPATRERVNAAIKRLGFVRNESARALRAGRATALTYVMLDASNPFFTDVAQGIEHVAQDAALSLFLCSSYGSREREAAYLSHAEQQRVHGVLVTPVDAHAEILEEIAQRGTPVVLVDGSRGDDSFCSVAVDDEFGGRVATEHLLQQGHRRIAMVGNPSSTHQVAARHQGMRNAWEAADLPPKDLSIIVVDDFTVAAGRAGVDRLMEMSKGDRPTAVFCANDLIALGVLQQAVSTGLMVPNDLAIVGYDDIEFASAAVVPITSVRQPRRELGRTAVELAIAERTDQDHSHRQVTFTPELIVRASSLTEG